MLHALLILLVVLLIIGWLVDHPRIALSLMLTVAGLIAWDVIYTGIQDRREREQQTRDFPKDCFDFEKVAELVSPDCAAYGRAAQLAHMPRSKRNNFIESIPFKERRPIIEALRYAESQGWVTKSDLYRE